MHYKIRCYGWEIEFIAHSLSNEQVLQILDIKEENGYAELTEARNDLEAEAIISDIYNGNLFHVTRALNDDTMTCFVIDENGKEVINFKISDMSDMYEYLGDAADQMPYEGYLAIPELIKEVDNVMLITDESKGGLYEMLFESDEVPTPKDFFYLPGDIGTPEGDFDVISKIFFKGKELEIDEYLDSRGKASAVQIFTKDGKTLT